MKRQTKQLVRWIATPFVAVFGYALGHIVWALIAGAISFFKTLPYVGFLGWILWISPLISTYLSVKWSIQGAERCAPGKHMFVIWCVLIAALIYEFFEYGLHFKHIPRSVPIDFVESIAVIIWFMVQAWKLRQRSS